MALVSDFQYSIRDAAKRRNGALPADFPFNTPLEMPRFMAAMRHASATYTFNTPLEMLERHACAHNAVPAPPFNTPLEMRFDASEPRVSLRRSAFNTPLEMRVATEAAGGPPVGFQYSIRDAGHTAAELRRA